MTRGLAPLSPARFTNQLVSQPAAIDADEPLPAATRFSTWTTQSPGHA
ncbi:MAG: hypothetical protein ACRDID_10925 [Ktedonobacterales bacterium]